MKIKVLFIAASFMMLLSCNEQKQEAKVLSSNETTADVKSLLNAFSNAWNKKDSAALVSQMADDIILLDDGKPFKGKQDLANKWIHSNLPVTSNLKITTEQEGASGDLAYTAGRWTLDANMPDNTVKQVSGSHTFVWKKQADGSWKASLYFITNDPAPKD